MAAHGAPIFIPMIRQNHYRRPGDYSFQRTVCFPDGSTTTFGPGDDVPQFHANSAFNNQVEEIDRLLTEVNATIERNRTFVPEDSDTDERSSDDEGVCLRRYPSVGSSYERQPSFASSYPDESIGVAMLAPSPTTHSLSAFNSRSAPVIQLGQNIDTITSQLYRSSSQFSSSSAPDERLGTSTDPSAYGHPASDDEETIIFTTESPPTIATRISPVRRASPAPRLPMTALHSRSESGHHLIPPTIMRWQPNAGSSRLGRMARERGLGVRTAAAAAHMTTVPLVVEGSSSDRRGTVLFQLMEEGQRDVREQITTADIAAGTAVLPLFYRPESRQESGRRPW